MVPTARVDVILSNCVINLSPEKQAVFDEAFRVLLRRRPAGDQRRRRDRTGPRPAALQNEMAAVCGCIGGAAPLETVRAMLAKAGFKSIEINVSANSAEIVDSWMPGVSKFIASAAIEARRGAEKAQMRVVCRGAADDRCPPCRGAMSPRSCGRSSRAAWRRRRSTTSCRTSSCVCSAGSLRCATRSASRRGCFRSRAARLPSTRGRTARHPVAQTALRST